MSSARERRKKRRERQQMAERVQKNVKQVVPEGRFSLPNINLQLPGGRAWFVVPMALLVVAVVVLGLRLINPPEAVNVPDGIWLDDSVTYTLTDSDDYAALARDLRNNNVGRVFAYVSSLKADATWSGEATGSNRFVDVEVQLGEFVEKMRAAYPSVELYAWVEVVAQTPEGYRLDSEQVQTTVASFSSRMTDRLGFDGVLLDVKPIFSDNADYLDLLTAVRNEIELGTPLAVAAAPDLTPQDADIVVSDIIAPGTLWSREYKQRVALKVDLLAVTAYNSYLTQPVDYIEWVTHQVDTYVEALQEVGSDATLLISVPNYAPNPPAHPEDVETLSGGLDGVRRAWETFDEETRPALDGIAYYTDDQLTDAEWRLIQQKWRN